jgi:hypothetical protein
MGTAVLNETGVLRGKEGISMGDGYLSEEDIMEADVSDVLAVERDDDDRMSYIDFVIHEFAETYKIDKAEGYLYLEKYGGLDYLYEHWWALHIENHFYAMRSIFEICKRNGGYMK